MSDLGRHVAHGAKNLGLAVLGKSGSSAPSGPGGPSRSGSRGGGGGSRGGNLDPHSFRYWWYYGGGKPKVHRRRRKTALIISGVGALMLLGAWSGLIPLGWGVLSVFLLGLVLAWVAFSGKMYVHPRKIIRKLSLKADYDYDDNIFQKITFVEALLDSGFIKDNVTPREFVCFSNELDEPNPWQFKVRILFQRYSPSQLQSSIENISLNIFNPDMPIMDSKKKEVIGTGAFCQRVVVEPDKKGRIEWFTILLYFDQEQAAYDEIGTPKEYRQFGAAKTDRAASGSRSGRPERSGPPGGRQQRAIGQNGRPERSTNKNSPSRQEPEGSQDEITEIEDEFSAFKDITNNKYGDSRTSAEKATERR